VRTEAAGEAALWLQCFRQAPTRVIAAQSSAINDPITRTADWTRLSTRVTAPNGTDFVVVRCVLKGAGTAWFDELRLDVIGEPAEQAPLEAFEPHEAFPPEAPEPEPSGALDGADLLQLSQALQRAVADLEASNAQIRERVRELQGQVQQSREEAEAISRDVQTYGAHPLVPHGYEPEEESQ
jgi:hypothetical protein